MIQSMFLFLNKNYHEFKSKGTVAEKGGHFHTPSGVNFDSEGKYSTNL